MKFFFIVLSFLVMIPQSISAATYAEREKMINNAISMQRGNTIAWKKQAIEAFRVNFCVAATNVLYDRWIKEIDKFWEEDKYSFISDKNYEFGSEETIKKSKIVFEKMQKLDVFQDISKTLTESHISIWCTDFIPLGFSDGMMAR